MKKNEIDLNLIPVSGEEFTYTDEELNSIQDLKENLLKDEINSVEIKIRPIDGPHYQLQTSSQI